PEPDHGEDARERDDHLCQHLREPLRERRAGDDGEQRREGKDEERELDAALLDVLRPEKRRGVERDERSSGDREQVGDRLDRAARGLHEERDTRGGENRVERQQQERVLAAEVDRQPERRRDREDDGNGGGETRQPGGEAEDRDGGDEEARNR